MELGAGIWNWVLGFRTRGWCIYLGQAFGTGVWDLELGGAGECCDWYLGWDIELRARI